MLGIRSSIEIQVLQDLQKRPEPKYNFSDFKILNEGLITRGKKIEATFHMNVENFYGQEYPIGIQCEAQNSRSYKASFVNVYDWFQAYYLPIQHEAKLVRGSFSNGDYKVEFVIPEKAIATNYDCFYVHPIPWTIYWGHLDFWLKYAGSYLVYLELTPNSQNPNSSNPQPSGSPKPSTTSSPSPRVSEGKVALPSASPQTNESGDSSSGSNKNEPSNIILGNKKIYPVSSSANNKGYRISANLLRPELPKIIEKVKPYILEFRVPTKSLCQWQSYIYSSSFKTLIPNSGGNDEVSDGILRTQIMYDSYTQNHYKATSARVVIACSGYPKWTLNLKYISASKFKKLPLLGR